MTITAAIFIVLGIGLLLLYLAMANIYFQFNMLRRSVEAQLAERQTNDVALEPTLRLPWTWDGQERRIALVVDSTCAACWAAVEEASTASGEPRLTLLTNDAPSSWDSVAATFTVAQDRASRSVLAHLSTPILLRVESDGSVADLVFPSRVGEVRDTINRWNSDQENLDAAAYAVDSHI